MPLTMNELQILSDSLLSNKCDENCIDILSRIRIDLSGCYLFLDVIMGSSASSNDDIFKSMDKVYDILDKSVSMHDFEMSLLLKTLLYLRASDVPGMHDLPDHIALQLEQFMSPSLRSRLLELAKYAVEPDHKEAIQLFALLPDGILGDGIDRNRPPRGLST